MLTLLFACSSSVDTAEPEPEAPIVSAPEQGDWQATPFTGLLHATDGVLVEVDEDFDWPSHPDGRVALRPVIDCGEGAVESPWLVEDDERFSITLLRTHLDGDVWPLLSDLDEQLTAYWLAVELEGTDQGDEALEAWLELFRDTDITLDEAEIEGAVDPACEVRLRPEVLDHDHETLHVFDDSGASRAEPLYEDWETKVTDEEDPCFDKTPQECAEERLAALVAELCERDEPYEHCELLEEAYAEGRLRVACWIERAAGRAHPETASIDMNGDLLITEDCSLGTLVHEAGHLDDIVNKDLDDLNTFNALALEFEALVKEVGQGRPTAEQREEAKDLMEAMAPLEPAAANLWLQGEIDAYEDVFAQRDAGLFDDMDADARMAWEKRLYVDSLNALGRGRARTDAMLTDDTKQAFCDVVDELQALADSDEDLKENLEEKSTGRQDEDGEISWYRAAAVTKRTFCD